MKRLLAVALCVVGACVLSNGRAEAPASCASTLGPHDVLVGSVSVAATSTTGTTYTLPSNGNYTFVACGTWLNTPHGVVDAAYNAGDSSSWTAPNPAIEQGWSLDGFALGANWGELQVNGSFVNWGAYSSTHVYSTSVTGASGAQTFSIFDGDSTTNTPNAGFYGDNSGSLSVDIYETLPASSPIPGGSVAVNWTQGSKECDSYFSTSTSGEIDQYWTGGPSCPVPVAGYPAERVAFHTLASGVQCDPNGLLQSGDWTFSYAADGGYADLTGDGGNLNDFLTVGTQYLVCYYPLQITGKPTTLVNWLQAGNECDSYMSEDGTTGVVQQWWYGAPACPHPVVGYNAVRVVFYPAGGGATCSPTGLLRSADWTFTYAADGGYTELANDGGNLSDFLSVGATYLICYYPVASSTIGATSVKFKQAGAECDTTFSRDGTTGYVTETRTGAPNCQQIGGQSALKLVFEPAAVGVTCAPTGLITSPPWTFSYSADGGYTDLTGDGGNLSTFLTTGSSYLVCVYPGPLPALAATHVFFVQGKRLCLTAVFSRTTAGVIDETRSGGPLGCLDVDGYYNLHFVFTPASASPTCNPTNLLAQYPWSFSYGADGGYTDLPLDGGNLSDVFATGVQYLACVYPVDSTPPVITASINGTTPSTSWYTTDATLTWSVTDPDSPITSQSGCSTVTVSTDTTGTVYTCTATSAGGTSTKSVTLKRSTVYQTGGSCNGQDGHTILGSYATNGSTTVKAGTAIALAFRVCDANGNPIGSGVVKGFRLIQINGSNVTGAAGNPQSSTSGCDGFGYTSSSKQWGFNLSTTGFKSGSKYTYEITLSDGSEIPFSFTAK